MPVQFRYIRAFALQPARGPAIAPYLARAARVVRTEPANKDVYSFTPDPEYIFARSRYFNRDDAPSETDGKLGSCARVCV